jgi:hypothetical protein
MTRSLHRQQLFHWIGRDIEQEFPGRSRDQREKRAGLYVGHLRNSLRDGIWVKRPEHPEEIGSGVSAKSLEMPIACFTEWSLADSQAHVASYGRLGFGFPRAWVSKRGGQPVTYMRPAMGSRYMDAVQSIVKASKHMDAEARESLDYILHFTKPVRPPRRQSSVERKPRSVPAPVAEHGRDPWARSFGAPMPYVSEREWRVVLPVGTPDKKGHWKAAGKGVQARFYLPYRPGADLFTLVLPDNLTMQKVVADQELMSHLMPKNAPHVTLLSLDDVDTF